MTMVRRAALVAVACALAIGAAHADAAETVAEPLVVSETGHFQLRFGDAVVEDAKIYRSEGVPRFLVESAAIEGPWLLVAGERVARRLPPDAVREVDGLVATREVDATRGGEPRDLKIAGRNVWFDTGAGVATLEPREPLIGEKSTDELFEFMPEYRRYAAGFTPGRGQMQILENVDAEIDVEVFFGTWCPHCEKLVPRVMRLSDELSNPKLRFHFHGLPTRFVDEPMARQFQVNAVPVLIVRKGGEVLQRFEGRDLLAPDKALVAALVDVGS